MTVSKDGAGRDFISCLCQVEADTLPVPLHKRLSAEGGEGCQRYGVIDRARYFLETGYFDMEMLADRWLAYCRPGFERDTLAELMHHASRLGIPCATESGEGWVNLIREDGRSVNDLQRDLPLSSLVFPRQSLVALPPLELARQDRLSAVVEQVAAAGWSFDEIWHETPDTNEGKSLNRLAKSLARPLESLLRKRKALRRKAGNRRLHLWWTSGTRVQLGISFPGNRSDLPGGIRRLRCPSQAPSRSTLKLEEAWHEFIAAEQWDKRIEKHMTAVDLGAAPGGWTWQLARRQVYTYAIDNGPMSKELMATGLVEHLREDGFAWEPPHSVDWLVCDMVEQPAKVMGLMEQWLIKRWCRECVFNLKLPMKRRWEEVSRLLAQLEKNLASTRRRYQIGCRHLYHDREEVTVHVVLLD